MSVLLTAVLVTMALSLSELAVAELSHVQSQMSGYGALLAAESGIEMFSLMLRDASVGTDVSSDNVMSRVEATLDTLLADQSGMTGSVYQSGSAVMVPPIQLGTNQTFETSLTLVAAEPMQIELRVTGRHGDATRTVLLQYGVQAGSSATWPIFEYGIVNVGTISVTGDSRVYDLDTDSGLADVMTFSSAAPAIKITGSSNVGNAYLTAAESESLIELTGMGSIGGYINTWPDYMQPALENSIFFDQEQPEIPEIDTATLKSLCTSSYEDYRNSWGGIDWNQTFDNVVVPAGTNPTFEYNHTVNGIVYIESPNRVRFNCPNIHAIIVTDNNRSYSISDNYIEISGASTMDGVAGAPETSEFDAVREYAGAGILAPSFEVNITASGTVNIDGGVIACDKLTVSGAGSGRVLGTVIGLADYPMVIANSGTLTIQRPEGAQAPNGFIGGGGGGYATLVETPGSYRESFE